ncbi:arylamine N-acetyltransferase [bacterium]|nr:arylamine N-acetyltransferase [bacterium]
MQDYWKRIGLTGPADLFTLVNAHARHIPFENLSILAGQPICIDPDSLWSKMVKGRRGGYCFEQNGLMEVVLTRLGYGVTPLAARVRRGVTEVRPHTHKLLRVLDQGQDYLVDVGFGGEGPSRPLPWQEGTWELQPGVTHRLVRQEDLWVLQCQHDGGLWLELYATDNRPRYPADFEMYNHYTSTFPTSIFVNSMLVSLHTERGYHILFDGLLRQRQEGRTKLRRLHSDLEIRAVLDEVFHLQPPPTMRCPRQER